RRHWHRPSHTNRLGDGERDDRLFTERSRPGNDGAKDKDGNVASACRETNGRSRSIGRSMNLGPGWAASTWRRLSPRCGPSIRPTTQNVSPRDGSSDVGSRTKLVPPTMNDDEHLAVEVAQFVQH